MAKKAADPKPVEVKPKSTAEAKPAPRIKPAIRNAQATAALEAARPEPKPVDEVAKALELPDSAYDPDLDGDWDEQPVAEGGPTDPPSKPRDPATGQFAPKSEHNPYFVDLAKEAGISESHINSMTPDQLQAAILFKSNLRKDTALQEAVKPKAEQPLDLLEQQLDLDALLPPEQYDENVRKAFKTLEGKYERRLAQLEGYLKAQATRESDNSIYSAFEKLGDKRLGNALTAKDSAEYRRMQAVFNEARRAAGEKADLPAVLAKLGEARDTILGALETEAPEPKAKTPTNGHSRISPEEWASSTTLKPTARTIPPEPKGEARAVKNLHGKLRELHGQGMTLEGKEEATV